MNPGEYGGGLHGMGEMGGCEGEGESGGSMGNEGGDMIDSDDEGEGGSSDSDGAKASNPSPYSFPYRGPRSEPSHTSEAPTVRISTPKIDASRFGFQERMLRSMT